MARGIPLRLLPHKVQHRPLHGNTGDGDEWGDGTTTRVRIEPKVEVVTDSQGRTITSAARVFMPAPADPQVGDLLVTGTKEWRIVAVDTLVNFDGTPHHHEVKVS